jgi:hypothetical protein
MLGSHSSKCIFEWLFLNESKLYHRNHLVFHSLLSLALTLWEFCLGREESMGYIDTYTNTRRECVLLYPASHFKYNVNCRLKLDYVSRGCSDFSFSTKYLHLKCWQTIKQGGLYRLGSLKILKNICLICRKQIPCCIHGKRENSEVSPCLLQNDAWSLSIYLFWWKLNIEINYSIWFASAWELF